MTNLQLFKQQLRLNRGRLAKMDKEMSDIFICGSELFKEYALIHKHVGVTKMADIVKTLDYEKQDEFVVWVRGNVVDVKAIDLKLLEMGGE